MGFFIFPSSSLRLHFRADVHYLRKNGWQLLKCNQMAFKYSQSSLSAALLVFARVHNSNGHAGPKNFFWHIKGPKLLGCNTFKKCFYQRNKQNKQNVGLRGQIKSVPGPHLARGPYVVHAWSKPHLHIRFPHAFSALHCNFHNLAWLSKTKVIYKKSQRSVVNACGNRMCT